MSGRALPIALCAALASGCATTRFEPRLVARGELVLRYDRGFAMSAGGREVAHGPTWAGLAEHVRCEPTARELAAAAAAKGRAGLATSILGASLGVLAIGGLYGLAVDDAHGRWALLGGGLGAAVTGLAFAIASQALRNGANGRAVDAMNHYNDAVGSLGATCDDLTYPPPAGPAPPGAVPPAPPAPSAP